MCYRSRAGSILTIRNQYGKSKIIPRIVFKEQPNSSTLNMTFFIALSQDSSIIPGFRPTWKNMSWEAAVQKIKTEHGNQQGADAEEWS